MYCTNCREKLDEDCRFCPVCGKPVEEEKTDAQEQFGMQYEEQKNGYAEPEQKKRQEPVYQQEPVFTGMQIRNYNPALDYNPIGMWGYFFYTILLNIPIIGWIFIILFSVGVTKNINLRNYARSWFCGYIIALILFLIKIWPYLEMMMQ